MHFTWALLIVLASGLSSCKEGSDSINDLYKFSGFAETKDVRVRVKLDYKTDAGAGPAVTVGEQKFLLNAYVFSSSEIQVAVGYEGGAEPVNDLPVTLTATSLVFDAVVRVPIEEGVDSYSIHFALREQASAASFFQQTTVKNLEALKGGVQAGVDPSVNVVPLSIASTMAYRLTTETEVDDGSSVHITVYEGLASKIAERVSLVEGKLDSSKTADLATFAAAIDAALKLEIVTDQTLQSKLVELLNAAVRAKLGDDAGPTALAAGFTELVKTFLREAKSVLGTSGNPELVIFKTGEIDPSSIPDPDTFVSIIFAPTSLAFVDTDASGSIGGNVVITPPPSKIGIASYNVYFGGSSLADAKASLVGNVSAANDPLFLAVAAGTTIPSGQTRFWAFPVVGSKELPIATSVTIVNDINTLPAGPTTVTAVAGIERVTVTWSPISGASSYKIYWSTTPGVSTSSSVLTSSASPLTHASLSGGTSYYYRVSAVVGGSETALSTVTASATATRTHFVWVGRGASSVYSSWTDAIDRSNAASTSGDDEYNEITAVAIDDTHGFIYLTDRNDRVVKLNKSTGAFIGAIGKAVATTGTCVVGKQTGWCTGGTFDSNDNDDGAFHEPYGLAIDPAGDTLFVASDFKISKFTLSTGAFVGSVGFVTAAAGGSTCTPSQVATSWCVGGTFNNPNMYASIDGEFSSGLKGLAIDPVAGRLYVADEDESRVLKLNASTGATMGAIGSSTAGTCGSIGVQAGWCAGGVYGDGSNDFGAFDSACSVAVDPANALLYVGSCGDGAVTKINLTSGASLGRIGYLDNIGTCTVDANDVAIGWCNDPTHTMQEGSSDYDGSFVQPRGMALDVAHNRFYVSNNDASNVAQFNLSTGVFIGAQGTYSGSPDTHSSTWETGKDWQDAPAGVSGNDYNGTFKNPFGIASSTDGYVYIGDAGYYRIVRLNKE